MRPDLSLVLAFGAFPSAGVALLAFGVGCSSAPAGSNACATNADCQAGWICAASTCQKLCIAQADCGEGTWCAPAGTCEAVSGGAAPTIDAILGNDPSDPARVRNGLVVSGTSLANAAFELRGATATLSVTTTVISEGHVEVTLPADVRSGGYVLVVTNAAGSAQQGVTLELPELDGATILGRLNGLDTGKLSTSRLNVGLGAADVAAGDHDHDSSYYPRAVVDGLFVTQSSAASTYLTRTDASSGFVARDLGESADRPALDCKQIYARNHQAASGVYWITLGDGPAFQAQCDMTTVGGGWLDLVETMHLPGANVATLAGRFFVTNGTGTLDAITATSNSSGAKGILITYSGGDHTTGFHFRSLTYHVSQVRTFWRMQGGNDNRCSSASWIPLNGPGFDGGHNAYLSACPTSYTCIQGRPEDGRDAPISAAFNYGKFDSFTEHLTWSGSSTGPVSDACARDAAIPSTQPAAFFEVLLLK